MDILAANLSAGNFSAFWKSTDKMNPMPSMPVSVGGVSDDKGIANNFRDHFIVSIGVLVDTYIYMTQLLAYIPT